MKLLKWGHTLLNIWSLKSGRETNSPFKEEMNERDVILKFLFGGADEFRKIRSYAEFESFRGLEKDDIRANIIELYSGEKVDYSERSFQEYISDLLEYSGILETVEIKMSYKNFQPGMLDLKDIDTEMGARRVCRETGKDIPIPTQRNIHDISFKSLDLPKNDWDMTAADLSNIFDSTLGRTGEDPKIEFEEEIRKKFKIKEEDKDVYYYRKLH